MKDKALPPSVILPNQGKTLCAFNDQVTFLLTGEQTGGKFTMFLETAQPGGGPPPHVHDCEDEWFHVLEGRASFFKEGTWTEVPVGTTVFLPKGCPHTFKNVGDTPLKMMVHTAPSGFETFFTRCEAECSRPGGPDMARVVQIAAEHGIRFL